MDKDVDKNFWTLRNLPGDGAVLAIKRGNSMSGYNSAVLQELLDGCLKRNRRSQELLYKQFYGYAMSICLRYTRSREEGKEILNDGFLKVFAKLDTYDPERPFKTWLSRIMINTALDHYRHELRRDIFDAVEAAEQLPVDESVISRLSHDELVGLIQRLTPSYRVVFSMYVIDGYTHEEIAEQLKISVGASKSNLSRAREKLREMLSRINIDYYDRVSR